MHNMHPFFFFFKESLVKHSNTPLVRTQTKGQAGQEWVEKVTVGNGKWVLSQSDT